MMAERVEGAGEALLDELVESAIYAVFGEGNDESDWARVDRAAVESRLRDYLARDFRHAESRALAAESELEEIKALGFEATAIGRELNDYLLSMTKRAETAEARVEELTKPGDALQSAASRMAEFVLKVAAYRYVLPYEVHMAALEAQSAGDEWTAARATREERGDG